MWTIPWPSMCLPCHYFSMILGLGVISLRPAPAFRRSRETARYALYPIESHVLRQGDSYQVRTSGHPRFSPCAPLLVRTNPFSALSFFFFFSFSPNIPFLKRKTNKQTFINTDTEMSHCPCWEKQAHRGGESYMLACHLIYTGWRSKDTC